jgi:hypothetical protein
MVAGTTWPLCAQKPSTAGNGPQQFCDGGAIMKKRGNILREPRHGPGLLMIEGRQFRFSLDGMWKSKLPPRPGLLVDVELDPSSQIIAIAAAGDLQSSGPVQQGNATVDREESRGLLKLVGKLLARNRPAAGHK